MSSLEGELSLPAQAAMAAYYKAPVNGFDPKEADAVGIGAAIRATTESVLSEDLLQSLQSHPDKNMGIMRQGLIFAREKFLVVASELEGHLQR